ncbi:MAG: tetratricopeptide repeat protein [bacterium]|nr:tetratricopeptide repeat protein [bacterium]
MITVTNCLVLVLLIIAPEALATDKVYPKQGVPASGTITNISPAKVTISVRGNDQNYELKDVLKITFDGEPNELERARDQYLNEQFDQALEEIKKIDPSSLSGAAIQQDVQFYRWYCEGKLGLMGKGDKNAAIRGLLAIVSQNRNTHHLYEVGEMLGELHLALGKPEDATRYFGVLLSAPDPDTKALGVYRLAQVNLASESFEEARGRFEQLMNAPSSSPEMTRLKSLAEVGLAVCDQKAGKNEEALKKLDQLIQKYPSTDYELFSQIYNAKGACHQQLGQTVPALLSYLKTDLLFFTEAEAHAEALYHLQSLWSEYGNPAKSADARERLVSQYAASKWANLP